jgi:salicylate hydroxylase
MQILFPPRENKGFADHSLVFNAILIIVSHVVDPEFQEDQTALAYLEQAMNMIRQMSVNHFCAQRAYTFLQQLLGLLDKTLPHDRQRIRTRSDLNSISPSIRASVVVDNNPSEELNTDLWSFWGATQDLTMDLGSQLDLHSDLGRGIWSWDLQHSGSPGLLD